MAADIALELPARADLDGFLRAALATGASVVSVSPRRESLEDLFVREAAGAATDLPPPGSTGPAPGSSATPHATGVGPS
jgi:hypothetical protein